MKLSLELYLCTCCGAPYTNWWVTWSKKAGSTPTYNRCQIAVGSLCAPICGPPIYRTVSSMWNLCLNTAVDASWILSWLKSCSVLKFLYILYPRTRDASTVLYWRQRFRNSTTSGVATSNWAISSSVNNLELNNRHSRTWQKNNVPLESSILVVLTSAVGQCLLNFIRVFFWQEILFWLWLYYICCGNWRGNRG